MSLMDILAIFTTMVILALVPGSSVILVVARSCSGGFSSGSAAVAGIVVGDLIFVLLAVLGMTALSEVVGSFLLVLRVLAAVYLIWFGINIIRSKASLQLENADRTAASLSSSFLSGLLITLGDVKAIFFYASLFPAFVDLATIGTIDIGSIAVVTVIAVGGVKLGYAYFARSVVSFATNYKAERAVKCTAGGLMVGAGCYLVVKT